MKAALWFCLCGFSTMALQWTYDGPYRIIRPNLLTCAALCCVARSVLGNKQSY